MKVTRFLVSLLFLGAASTSAFADGAVSLNWDSCTGPINKDVAPGSLRSANVMFISVLGQSIVHQAYQVQVTVGGNGPLRDAWRFDPAGCQGTPYYTIDHLSLAKSCPSFQGTLQSVQVKDFAYDALTGKAKISLYNAYPNNPVGGGPAQGNPGAITPTTRYFLGSVSFDETYGVTGPTDPGNTCGGLEVGTCFHLTSQTWLDLNGNEIPWAIAQEYVTSHDAANAMHCPGATPTTSTTWGSLKNQYR
jgi:hypothetical protein